ncbi:MAG: NAD-glutamate dehydrogenase [Sphingomicrobium sp.]|nr:NAD-glutamate dehydrogenase [Sphingomonadales bacterium]
MTAQTRVDESIAGSLRKALLGDALPGEVRGFGADEQAEAARFVAQTAAVRPADQVAMRLESSGGDIGYRRLRLAIVNDDMPFLVDSVAGAISSRGLAVHRLLHPIVNVKRDPRGKLVAVGEGKPESIIYIEFDRADARGRHELSEELDNILADVRAAVADWPEMTAQMKRDAEGLDGRDEEGAALLRWLADNHFTLLGHVTLKKGGTFEQGLGILRRSLALWDDGEGAAVEHLAARGLPVQLLKADRVSPVHRRVPLDIVLVRRKDGMLSIHAGLWTSAALRSPAEQVPVLRQRLEELDRELGFARHSHAAKALTHAISTLPHDLLISLAPAEVREAALTAMSLADRPRPTLLLLPGALRRHLFAFVWLPRDELTTRRRIAIGRMIEAAIGSRVASWSVELGDGDLALIRYSLPITPATKIPNPAALDATLVNMVRGWAPAVETELVASAGASRATRLALTYLSLLSEEYRSRTPAKEAAIDICRLADLGEGRRGARLVRLPGDAAGQLHLKTYRLRGMIALSEAVPVLENFGFRVLEEFPTPLGDGSHGTIHDFLLELPAGTDLEAIMARAGLIEGAISDVLGGTAENDPFNQLILFAELDPQPVVWLRAWFRYLRQTGVAYGLATVVDALRRAPRATGGLIALFTAAHALQQKNRDDAVARERAAFDEALRSVSAIDDDRILRLLRSVVDATLRTNAFAPAASEAIAFKFDSALVPGLPRPLPWREIWVYSPRVEGIHLRGGPVARGGLRWSDRRDDFRTEILGLMKAQLVKNAVIVPTGAKGGFYAKHLPPASNRDAWLAEGTEAYRIFIRALLSITDNIVEDKVVHPEAVVTLDGDDPYFVVAADKGTATFSDIANATALERGFWLGDAFASGGSNGYDHKAMGITAKGAWISVQRHFREMGVDVQSDSIRVVGCGDMSGDVFGNGMLLSKELKLIAAFDHRHIFIDPNPDPAKSWAERERMFALPRSSWDDYDRKAISKGGMIIPRSQKSISLSKEAAAALGLIERNTDPTSLINAILKAEVDLIWFGGIGTYVKASTQPQSAVGDPANDALRVDANEVRAKAIGEGANLAITQVARIQYASLGGRINTDFIDNSAGVDCSDNEVNIKIPLNREMREGRLAEKDRNRLLATMTDEVSELVLEDNRLQSLALSIAEARGTDGLAGFVRTIEILEASGRLDRKVEGIDPSDALLRRGGEGRGLTRPELAVLLSMSKMALQAAGEKLRLADDPLMEEELFAAFPKAMIRKHAEAVRKHRLRHEIVATKVANRLVNRLGPSSALDLTEEEGVALAQVVSAFLVTERLLELRPLWAKIEEANVSELVRIRLFASAARSVRNHVADVLRAAAGETNVSALVELLQPGLEKVAGNASKLIRTEVRAESAARRQELLALGADAAIVDALIRLYELDGVFAIAALGSRKGLDELAVTRAYTQLGEALGLDWAQHQLARFMPSDPWERLLIAGLSRDFEQLRIDFLGRGRSGDPDSSVERWVERNSARIDQFRSLVARARGSGTVSVPMLAQIASQARILLAR